MVENMRLKQGTFKHVLLLVSLPLFPPASATINVINTLSFGNIAIGNNSTPSEITVQTNGQVSNTNHIWRLEPGHPAEIVLTDYPPYVELTTTVSIIQSETTVVSGNTEQFTLTEVYTAPSVVTNIAGEATVYIGGTLRTSGNSGNYLSTQYQALYKLTISY